MRAAFLGVRYSLQVEFEGKGVESRTDKPLEVKRGQSLLNPTRRAVK